MFCKVEIKSPVFFFKSVTYSFPWKRGTMSGIFLLFKKIFTNAQEAIVFFFRWVKLCYSEIMI